MALPMKPGRCKSLIFHRPKIWPGSNRSGKTTSAWPVSTPVPARRPPIIDEETGEITQPTTESGDKGSKSDKAESPKGAEPQASGKLLQDTLAIIGRAATTDELDEVYIRAEGSFEGTELEQVLRAYRSRKSALANPSSSANDIFGEDGK